MQGTAKFVFPVVITGMIVFVVSGVLTAFNIGLRHDFAARWLPGFAVGWPVAAATGYFAMPLARSLTERLVTVLERSV